MKYDLLPCPFCACRLIVVNDPIDPKLRVRVRCRNCGASGPYPATTGDEREAVALWNGRRDNEPDTDE